MKANGGGQTLHCQHLLPVFSLDHQGSRYYIAQKVNVDLSLHRASRPAFWHTNQRQNGRTSAESLGNPAHTKS